jgi:hypothetical protein
MTSAAIASSIICLKVEVFEQSKGIDYLVETGPEVAIAQQTWQLWDSWEVLINH